MVGLYLLCTNKKCVRDIAVQGVVICDTCQCICSNKRQNHCCVISWGTMEKVDYFHEQVLSKVRSSLLSCIFPSSTILCGGFVPVVTLKLLKVVVFLFSFLPCVALSLTKVSLFLQLTLTTAARGGKLTLSKKIVMCRRTIHHQYVRFSQTS